MTDTESRTLDATTDDGSPDGEPPTSEPTGGSGSRLDPNSEKIRRYLAWGALVVCSLLAVVALIRFYGSVASAIGLWIDPKFQPLMRAAFNLVVLLASLIGVSLVVRELS